MAMTTHSAVQRLRGVAKLQEREILAAVRQFWDDEPYHYSKLKDAMARVLDEPVGFTGEVQTK